MKGDRVDLSALEDKEVNELLWAAYDMNAAVLKLINAGLVESGGVLNIEEVTKVLAGEMKMRGDEKGAKERNGVRWSIVDRPSTILEDCHEQ